jgi:hypothetical protein
MVGIANPSIVIASQRVGAKAPPDDRLREAIRCRRRKLDCFVAALLAMTAANGTTTAKKLMRVFKTEQFRLFVIGEQLGITAP